MRNPSIHVTKSVFIELLDVFGIKNFPIDDFFVKARQLNAVSRAVQVSNKQIAKKLKTIKLAKLGDAHLAADILYSTQIALKHRGVKKISEVDGSRWTQVKKLAEVCNIFCNDFNLEPRSGYITYMKIGFARLGKSTRNSLPRLVSMASSISEQYEAEGEILNDNSPETTKEIHDYYCRIIANKAGFKVDHTKTPETYVHFIRLREFCEKNNIDPEEWLEAQFDGLGWCNGIPEVTKLLGDKANEYYAKFRFRNTPIQKNNQEPKVVGSLWDKIRERDE